MCACAVCGGEEEVETQIRKPAGEGGIDNTHKRHTGRASTVLCLGWLHCLTDLSDDDDDDVFYLFLQKQKIEGWEQGASAGEGGGHAIGFLKTAVGKWGSKVVGE